MEEKWNRIISIIKDIEGKNTQLESYLSKLSFLSREAILENIYKDILMNHPISKKMGFTEKQLNIDSIHEKPLLIKQYIGNTILNIKKNPAKNVFYLRKFLDKFSNISDSDKDIVLQSLKDIEIENLENKLSSLIKIFKIESLK